MRKSIPVLCIAVLVLFTMGCQTTARDIHTVPVSRNYEQLEKVKLDDVEPLVQEAQRVGAESFAPFEYASAQAYLELARDQKREKDSVGVSDYAGLAKKMAEAAIRKGGMTDKGALKVPGDKDACAAEFDRLNQRYNELDKDKAAAVAPAAYAHIIADLSLAEHEMNQGRLAQAGRAMASVEASIDTLWVLDSDKDGVPDMKDGAPCAAEDKDGFEDEDGAPDLDNDQDGVPDTVDAAPGDPETKNRWHDHDGAPDAYPALDAIYFDTASEALSGAAQGYLLGVIQLLNEWPELKLHVAGYTDNTHAHKYSMELSRRRAEKVQGFLLSNGVPAERLVVTFHGDAEPAGDNATAEGRTKNRRVTLTFE